MPKSRSQRRRLILEEFPFHQLADPPGTINDTIFNVNAGWAIDNAAKTATCTTGTSTFYTVNGAEPSSFVVGDVWRFVWHVSSHSAGTLAPRYVAGDIGTATSGTGWFTQDLEYTNASGSAFSLKAAGPATCVVDYFDVHKVQCGSGS